MPRQRAFQKVDEQKAERLEVIAARLRALEVRVERGVVCSAREILLLKRQVAVVLVHVHARQAKIDDIENLVTLAASQNKIVGLNKKK